MLFSVCFSLKRKQALFNIVYCKFQKCYFVLSRSVMSNSVTPWTAARQAPLSMGIFQARILKWVAMIKPKTPALQADSLPSELPGKPFCNLSVFKKLKKPWKLCLHLFKV